MEIIRQLFLNKYKFRSKNIRVGMMSRISSDTYIEGNNYVGKFSYLRGKMNKYSYIGDNCFISGEIGRFCSISSNVRVISGRHPLKSPFVSTSPFFYSPKTKLGFSFVKHSFFDEYIFADNINKYSVIIGNDCWIGYGVSLIEGIKIGDGACILANATVTKNIPPYAIVGGVPAKILGYRYDDATIEKLLQIKWWDKD